MKKNIIIGGKDRSYYRDMSHNALREQADYGIDVDWKELAIALTERLDTIRAEVYEETRDMCMCDCACY